jgi:hypothetical protein
LTLLFSITDPNFKTRHRGTSSSPTAHPPPQLQQPGSNHSQKKQGRGKSGSRAKSSSEDVLIVATPEEAAADNANMIYIVMGCTMGLVVILIALASAALAYVRTRKVANTAESSGFLHVYVKMHLLI